MHANNLLRSSRGLGAKATIVTSGRTDLEDFIRVIAEWHRNQTKLTHHPMLAFLENGQTVTVLICETVADVLGLAKDTKVMAQWPGKWRSDFFQFTVGELDKLLAAYMAGYAKGAALD